MVLWTVFIETLKVSERQLEVLRGLRNPQGKDLSDNYRQYIVTNLIRGVLMLLSPEPYSPTMTGLCTKGVFPNLLSKLHYPTTSFFCLVELPV